MPFHYIHPLHEKAMISNKNEAMLEDRVEELDNFLQFVISNQDLFECDAFWKFFDSTVQDTKVGEILNQMKSNTYDYIDFTLKKRYGNAYE